MYEETVITAIRKTLTATAVATAVLAGSAACGTVENLSAGQKLDNAFEKLGKERSLSLEFDLDTDVASLKALDAEMAEPGDKMPDEVAELLSGARISLSVQSKKPLEKSGEKDFSAMAVKFSNADGDLFEYRLVGDYTYARVDADALAKMSGAPMPTADELPDSAGAFKKLLAGEWLKVSTKELEETSEQMSGAEGPGGAEPSAEPTLDARTQKKITKALRQVIADEVDFKTSGGSDGTEHIKATAPFRTLMTELFDELRPLQKELPGGAELPTTKDFADAPNEKVTADFTLKNGELTEVSVDLAKLAETAKVKKFALVLRVGKGQKATAPAGATEVRIDELMEGFFSGAGAAFGEEGFDGEFEGEFEEDFMVE
ncbi:hypothetical protein GCM10010293_28470 [Streptomyces griseoflavus]|uniref:hypothetical protein n=1 Tax=Streptomyces griseoflavus TaxID=35619 RepID=UPI00167E2341|nr:hypothetical protein [Streptomyces griseoflavus]GGV28778.1 hypothetical protein GCM10010293_28470 [Streptomyces griseoflavus]